MKRLPYIITALTVCLGLRVSGSEAIPFYGVTGSTIVGFANGGAGFAFSPLTDIEVTSLGFNGSDLASENYTINLLNAAGSPLATALITSSDPLFNQTRYTSITALTLAAGSTNYLQAVGVTTGMWLGDAIIGSGPDMNGSFTVASQISYLGYAVGTNGLGVFPNEVGTPSAYLIGPNFQFTVVPEPSVIAMGGLCLAVIAWRRGHRRHS